MSLVARLWTFSISTLSYLNLGCQIILSYSKCGRTIVVKNLGMVTLSWHVKVAFISPNRRDTFATALKTWSWNFSSSSIYTPNSLPFLVSPINCEFIWYISLWFELPRWRLLHLASLNPSCHLFNLFTRLSRSCCWTSWSSIVLISRNSFVSSAFHNLFKLSFQFIKIKFALCWSLLITDVYGLCFVFAGLY